MMCSSAPTRQVPSRAVGRNFQPRSSLITVAMLCRVLLAQRAVRADALLVHQQPAHHSAAGAQQLAALLSAARRADLGCGDDWHAWASKMSWHMVRVKMCQAATVCAMSFVKGLARACELVWLE